eukprot:Sspe_Gene.42318::Locus_20547_Transcript_1_1_Confidence_1.000_Length_1102::g.42318::m.42318
MVYPPTHQFVGFSDDSVTEAHGPSRMLRQARKEEVQRCAAAWGNASRPSPDRPDFFDVLTGSAAAPPPPRPSKRRVNPFKAVKRFFTESRKGGMVSRQQEWSVFDSPGPTPPKAVKNDRVPLPQQRRLAKDVALKPNSIASTVGSYSDELKGRVSIRCVYKAPNDGISGLDFDETVVPLASSFTPDRVFAHPEIRKMKARMVPSRAIDSRNSLQKCVEVLTERHRRRSTAVVPATHRSAPTPRCSTPHDPSPLVDWIEKWNTSNALSSCEHHPTPSVPPPKGNGPPLAADNPAVRLDFNEPSITAPCPTPAFTAVPPRSDRPQSAMTWRTNVWTPSGTISSA